MSTHSIKWTVAGGVLAIMLGVSPCSAQDEGRNNALCKPGRPENRCRMGEGRTRGRDQGKGQRGQRMREMMRKRMLENLPGAKEEIERHRQAMEAIKKKVKTLWQEIKDSIKNTGDKDAKRQALEGAKKKLEQLAGELVDENLAHAQKMLDLRKANREQAVKRAAKMLMRAGAKRHRRRMRDNREEGDKAMRRRRGPEGRRFRPKGRPDRRGRNGNRGAPDAPPEGADGDLTENDLASALEDALK